MMLWSKFYWNDWRADPGLRASSIAARGLWMECLCIAADSDPFGYVLVNGRVLDFVTLARIAGVSEAEAQSLMAELDQNGVFSRDRNGRIYSRRMVRDAKRAAIASKNGNLGGNPSLSKDNGISPSVNPPDKAAVNTQKPEARSQKPERVDDESLKFEVWYAAYPRHVGRGAALRAYRAARKKADSDTLLVGAQRAAEQYADTDPQFIPYPATWLNAEHWLDTDPVGGNGAHGTRRASQQSGPDSPIASAMRVAARRGLL